MERYFAHETLDAYRLAVDFARWARTVRFPTHCKHLRTQFLKATDTMVLNIAEGHSHVGDSRRHHYRVAKASAAETCAVLDLVDTPQGPARQTQLRRIGCMMSGLLR